MSIPSTADPLKPQLRHSLSSIDKESLTATCAICGPTKVRQYIRHNKYTNYICIAGNRQRSMAYQLAHPKISRLQQRRTTSHILSNVDDGKRTATCSICGTVKIYIRRGKVFDTRVCKNAAKQRSKSAEKKRQTENLEFIENHKLSLGCKNCDQHNNSIRLEFHAPGKTRREDHINKLLRFTRERLILELQKYEVICKSCHDKIHAKPPSKSRRKHKPLPFKAHTN